MLSTSPLVFLAVVLVQTSDRIEDVKSGGIALSNIEALWHQDGHIEALKTTIESRGPLTEGLKISILVRGRPTDVVKQKVCGLYRGAVTRPMSASEEVKLAMELDTGLVNQRCFVESIEFYPFKSAADIIDSERTKEALLREAEAEKLEFEKQEAERAKVAAELIAVRKRLAIECGKLYARTAQKRIVDLTVSESDQINSCKQLGLFSSPPSQPTNQKPKQVVKPGQKAA